MAGLLKPATYNFADSNIANLGSEFEKKARLHAAQHEEQWKTAGKEIGLQIWRIENFKVIPLVKGKIIAINETYGKFYSGDSYIILNTYKKESSSPQLSYNIHFWIGLDSSQDEYGTAAYKTVELDDFLGCTPAQFREVQGHESETFLSYFTKIPMQILAGGIASGFHHVKPAEYQKRLFRILSKRVAHHHVPILYVKEIPCSISSINRGDVFILDNGLKIYQWNGKECSPSERTKAAQVSRAIDSERLGKATITVFDDDGDNASATPFFDLLGDAQNNSIKSAAEAQKEDESTKIPTFVKSLYKISDAHGALAVTPVQPVAQKSLKDEDTFLLDTGSQAWIWVGKKASMNEKKHSLQYAQDYLKQHGRPVYLPIAKICSGLETPLFISEIAVAA